MKSFVIALGLFAAFASATQNESCHDALEDCLHEYVFQNPNDRALDRCGQRAISKYGDAACSACYDTSSMLELLVNMNPGRVVKSSGMAVSDSDSDEALHVTEDCLVGCYHTYGLDSCDETGFVSCAQTCLSNATDDTQCQDDLVDCFTKHYGRDRPMQNCMDHVFPNYGGWVNCASCFANPDRYMSALSTTPATGDAVTCQAGCFRTYLNDCSDDDYLTCALDCYFSPNLVVKVESKQEVTQQSSYMVPLVALCAALLVGVFAGKKIQKRNQVDLYDQLG